jgi:hypothetical protein
MDRDIIRAYLWRDAIRLGFCPLGSKDRKRWLLQYRNSLGKFWEIGEHPFKQPFIDGQVKISCKQFCIDFDMYITGIGNYEVHFLYCPANKQNELMWIHGVDSHYFSFPEQSFLTKHNRRKDAIRRMDEYDMVAVIDGLVCHPHTHQHIEAPIDQHEIRIGGGINNAFLFLFHLRYQLCPIEKKRESERLRLINLFRVSIEGNKRIQPNLLMAQPEET